MCSSDLWIPSAEVEAGAEVPVKVFLRPYRGGRVEREIKLKVPAGLTPGNYRIQLSEAAALNNMQSLTPMANRFMELAQTISLLNQERANNRLYATLLQPRPTVYTDDTNLNFKPSTGEFSARVLTANNGIVTNSLTVVSNYTIAAGQSGMSAGPISVASGVTVTISAGSRWVIL